MPALRPIELDPQDSADVEAQRLLGRRAVRSSRPAGRQVTTSNGNSAVGGRAVAGGARVRGGAF